MKLRSLLAICFIVLCYNAGAQSSLFAACSKLDQALVKRDTVALKMLLHEDLSYGHSNGWIEKKNDLVANLFNGRITYSKVESEGIDRVENQQWATVRSKATIEYVLDGKPGALQLHVMQVWVKDGKGGWQLVARQSTKWPEAVNHH